MQFSLLDDQSRDTSPSIMVTFPDGYSDKIILRKHNHNEKNMNGNECSYYGHLFKEKETCVAMTGCVGSEDILFTIMSAHSPGSSHFLWNQEGEAYTVEPYEFVSKQINMEFKMINNSEINIHSLTYNYDLRCGIWGIFSTLFLKTREKYT